MRIAPIGPPVMRIQLTVNGEPRALDVPEDLTLLSALRDDLGLTGAKYGCGHGACGACVVLVDDDPIAACTVRIADVAGRRVRTVEGLESRGVLHRVQRAFIDEDAMQCGYCTSGLVMAAVALLERTPQPTDDEIRAALAPHLCRCGVYGRVIRAVRRAAA